MRQQHPLLANHGLGRHPQIGRGVLARQLCTLDKRVEDDFGTALGLATVVVFAPDHWTADGALGRIVGERCVGLVEERWPAGTESSLDGALRVFALQPVNRIGRRPSEPMLLRKLNQNMTQTRRRRPSLLAT